jgi:hypothetical protein
MRQAAYVKARQVDSRCVIGFQLHAARIPADP